jgi:CheY-like chemotaxis protein
MPGMDGLTLCREIRKLSEGTVSIIVTAYAGGTTSEEFLQAGARQVLRKPVDVRELIDALRRHLDHPGLSDR